MRLGFLYHTARNPHCQPLKTKKRPFLDAFSTFYATQRAEPLPTPSFCAVWGAASTSPHLADTESRFLLLLLPAGAPLYDSRKAFDARSSSPLDPMIKRLPSTSLEHPQAQMFFQSHTGMMAGLREKNGSHRAYYRTVTASDFRRMAKRDADDLCHEGF